MAVNVLNNDYIHSELLAMKPLNLKSLYQRKHIDIFALLRHDEKTGQQKENIPTVIYKVANKIKIN